MSEETKSAASDPVTLQRNFIIDTWDDIDDQTIQIKKIPDKTASWFNEEQEPQREDYTLTKEDKEAIKQAFYKYDKKKTGFVQIDFVPDIFRYAGQNPSKQLSSTLILESNKKGYGVVFLSELMPIFQRHWKSQKYGTSELKSAIKTLSTEWADFFLVIFEVFKLQCCVESSEDPDMITISDLKKKLASYGEVLDKADLQLFEKTLDTIKNDQISVDSKLLENTIVLAEIWDYILLVDFMKVFVKGYYGDKSLHKKASKVKMVLKVKSTKKVEKDDSTKKKSEKAKISKKIK